MLSDELEGPSVSFASYDVVHELRANIKQFLGDLLHAGGQGY